jgi:hypothetical protein
MTMARVGIAINYIHYFKCVRCAKRRASSFVWTPEATKPSLGYYILIH